MDKLNKSKQVMNIFSLWKNGGERYANLFSSKEIDIASTHFLKEEK